MPSLTQAEVDQLKSQGCSATDWSKVSIDAGADLSRFRNAHFHGVVTVGVNRGHATVDGVDLPCGIIDATVADCVIGANVRIARVGSVVARCRIEDGTVIQDVASLTTDANCTFGAGTVVDAVNEGGGRTVRLVPALSAQTAYLQAFRRHSDEVRRALERMLDADVAAARSDHGIVGANARVLHCGPIRNVAIGPHATVRGSALLEDGTILSCAEHPTMVGEGVHARHFIIAEGASVASGALLDKVYVGQASRVGKQFSAEHVLCFANCEMFHGEAVSAFAGPYTVTHHKGTLLIAAGFSFYNAGSGTNQSNHMYKLGPVHQGVFERGTKTGSFAYVLHETHVGAFSVIIGKHLANLNTPDLPFSYIHEVNGQSEMIPGMNIASVGTVRDGEKWLKRDGRKALVKRDLISFGVFTPYTVEKMRAGRAILRRLHETTPKEKLAVQYGGVAVKRLLLRKGAKYYTHGVTRYLHGRVLERIEGSGATSWAHVQNALRHTAALSRPLAWTDVGGLLMPVERLQTLEREIAEGSLASLDAVQRRFTEIAARYDDDEWEYVCAAFAEDQGYPPEAMTREQAASILTAYDEAAAALQAMVLDDSRKEFGAFARIGFGLGMSEEERMAEFTAVRGSADTNAVVQKLLTEQDEMSRRSARLTSMLARLT